MDVEEEERSFKFSFVSTLQHMAQVKVASILVNASNKTDIQIVKNRIEELQLPNRLKEDLTLVASHLMNECRKWSFLIHRGCKFMYENSFLRQIQWTCRGLIDQRETFKCICEENGRLFYYFCLKENNKEIDLADIYFSLKNLECSTSKEEYLDLQTLELRVPNFFDDIASRTHEGIFMTVWNLSNNEQRKTLIREVKLHYFKNPDLIILILSQMPKEKINVFFRENVACITRVLSHWLWVDKAAEIILKGYGSMSPSLLRHIIRNLSVSDEQCSSTALLVMLKLCIVMERY